MYRSKLGDPEWNQNIRDARSSGRASVFRDRSADVDPQTNGVWITRKETIKPTTSSFVQPPYLPVPKRGEHDTAEAAVEVLSHMHDDIYRITDFLCEKGSTICVLKEAFLDLCTWYEVAPTDFKKVDGSVSTETQYETVVQAYEMAADLYESAKKAVVWIESREAYHFQDIVNTEDEIKGAVDSLCEYAYYYGDESMKPPKISQKKENQL